MPVSYVNSGETLALDLLAGKVTSAPLVLGLYTGDITPAEDTNIGSLAALAPGGGYDVRTVTPAHWTTTAGAPSAMQVNTATASYGWTFTASLGPIYGYYYVQAGTNKLFAAERFTGAPFTVLRSGDAITIIPRIEAE